MMISWVAQAIVDVLDLINEWFARFVYGVLGVQT